MKAKLKSVLTLVVFVLGVVLSLGFLHAGKTSAQAASAPAPIAETDQKVSNWLLQAKYAGGTSYQPVRGEVQAGSTSGYGKFELNRKDVVLTTSANVGFQLVGWNVTYTTTVNEDVDGQPTPTQKEITTFLHNQSNEQTTSYTIESESYGGQTVELTMNYTDTDADGYFDAGSFKISNIFSDMTVDAVFDYIYYRVEIENAFDLITIANQNSSSFDSGAWTIYFESNERDEANNRYVYHNAYLQQGGKYYYYGTIYSERSSFFYTTHFVGGEEQKIDIFRGNLRLGEEAQFTMDIDIDELSLEHSVNVDVLAVFLTQNDVKIPLNEGTTGNFAKIYKESVKLSEEDAETYTGRTTKIEVGLTIVETKTKTQTISLNYHQLYLATININVDNQSSTSKDGYILQSINEIRKNLTINYFYCPITTDQFFVKNANDNENKQTFELYCNAAIYGPEGREYYLYYTFSNLYLTGNVNNPIVNGNHVRYANIIDDFEINVEYISATYSISFEPYLKIDERNLIKMTADDFPGFNVNERVSGLHRGSQYYCPEPVQNVGYKFYGYSLYTNNFSKYDPGQPYGVEIDFSTPENLTVLAIYEYARFNLQLAGYDAISLSGKGEIMPISALTLQINDGETIGLTRHELDAGTPQEVGKNLMLSGTYNLKDKLSFSASLNEGFNADKFVFFIIGANGEKLQGEKTTFSFEITQDFLTQLFAEENLYQDGVITVNVEEVFERYSFTYYINPTNDRILQRQIIMADISLELAQGSEAEMTTSTFADGSQDAPVQQISVSNLKLYEIVKLVAKSRIYSQGGQDYSYDFVRFTADNKTSLSHSEEGGKYTYDMLINADNLWVKVVFTPQTSTITIATNKSAALSSAEFENHIAVSQANASVPIHIDENNQVVELNAGPFTIKFKDEQNPFNFGFAFIGYTLTTSKGAPVETVDATNLSSPFEAVFNIQGRESYVLTLNFQTVMFDLTVAQYGEYFMDIGWIENRSDELVNFDGGTILTLSVEDGFLLRYNLPEGSFVNKFYFDSQDNLVEVAKFAATTSKDASVYSREFSLDDVQQYFVNFGSYEDYTYTVKIRVEYKVYRYDLNVKYEFLSSKGAVKDGRIVYPSLKMTYSLNENEHTTTLSVASGKNGVVFENVPYGVSPTISLTSTLPVGYISIFNWSYSNTISPSSTGQSGGLPYICLTKLVADETLVYKIEYQAIKVKVGIFGNTDTGNPVANPSSMGNPVANPSSVELFDSLQISANPNKNLGYKFSHFLYYYNYTFGQSRWEEFKNQAYVFASGRFVPADEEYVAGTQYYLAKEVGDSSVFVDREVDFNNYAVVDNSIYFYVVYGYINVNIKNLSEDLFVPGEYETSLKIVGISPEDYADYFVYRQTGSGWAMLEEGEGVTIRDRVMVLIKIKTANVKVASGANKQLEVDLARGLRVLSVSYGLQLNYNVEFDGKTYNCSTEFNVNDIITNVDDEENLTLAYTFRVDFKTVNMTTNIQSDNFYFDNTTTKFVMNFAGSGEFSGAANSTGRKNLNVQMQFLGAAQFSYEFKTGDGNYFRISSITFRHDGDILTEEDYLYYGIEVPGNLNSFYVRFLDNLEIILHVEPNLRFYNISNFGNTTPLPVEPDQNGNYWLSKEFLCNNDASGIRQGLSKGQNNANIVADSIIVNALNIEFYNETGNKVEPVDVGVYQVMLSFRGNGSNYNWLAEIELNYKIYFEITKLPITVIFNDNFADEQEYWGGCELDFSRIANNLIIRDDFGGRRLYLPYGEDCNIQFRNTAVCYVTKTNDLGVEYRFGDAESGLNITIVGLQLFEDNFGKNFVLKFQPELALMGDGTEDLIYDIVVVGGRFTITKKQLTILGIQVFDKVEDGTTNVDYDVVNWSFGEGLIEADAGLVNVDFSNVVLAYEDGFAGDNKRIVVGYENALINTNEQMPRIQNYTLHFDDYYRKIYPYSVVAADIDGIGDIVITNPRGRMNANDASKSYRQYVSLIPIGAQLNVTPIYLNSNEYRDIYSVISSFLSYYTEFALGYKFELLVGEYHTEIDNNLYITLPGVARLAKVLWQANGQTDELNYLVDGNMITVDLSQISAAIESILFLRAKDYLAWWQIGLIILLILILILIIVLIFIHERRKKKLKDLMNEKI